jgi:hypothetical protein
VFYDALQCYAGAWVTLATTVCGDDGGPDGDGGPLIFDAGSWEASDEGG